MESFRSEKKGVVVIILPSVQEGKFQRFNQYLARADPVGDQAVLRAGVLLGAHGGHVDVILQFQLGLLVVPSRHELDDEGVLDGEDGVVVEVVALSVEDLRRDWFVAVSQRLCRMEKTSGTVGLYASTTLGKLTMRWMCAGLYGCRSSSWSSFPAGPSYGTG